MPAAGAVIDGDDDPDAEISADEAGAIIGRPIIDATGHA